MAHCCWETGGDCFISRFPLSANFSMFLDSNSVTFFFFFFLKQECDQVHIEDVASDDNGQDLRWCTDECVKCVANVIWFWWGLQTQKGWRAALCRG